MNAEPFLNAEFPQDSDADLDGTYSLEVIAELAGVSTQTVIRYRESGFLRSQFQCDGEEFDAGCLRRLRRIEHLRDTCEMNEAGLSLILNLLDEVEWLREERRRAMR